MRWGELTEVRVRDLDFTTCILTVSRAVIELSPDDRPDGGRFLVKDYPKDKEYRRFKLSQQITRKIETHVTARSLGLDDLLFTYVVPTQPRSRARGNPCSPSSGSPSRTSKAAAIGTAHSRLTTRRNAGASTAGELTHLTGLHAVAAERIRLGHRVRAIRTAISQPTGSGIRSGTQPARPPVWARSEFMI